MVLLFTQAVVLDFSEVVSHLVSILLMCDASGSECDSDACWNPCALQAPWIRLICVHLPSHSAKAVFQTQVTPAGMNPLECWSEGLFFSCFLLLWDHWASLLHGEMWAPQIKKAEKKEPRAGKHTECTSNVEQLQCHVSERKGYTLI